MKRKRLNYLVIAAIAVSVAFTSCNKDLENPNTVKLLETVIDKGYIDAPLIFDRLKFEYDKQYRITKISYYNYDGSIYYTETFTYAGEDLVQVLYSFSSGSIEMYEYTKSGNTITQKYTYNGDGIYIPNFTTTSNIELDSDGLPVKQEREEETGSTYVEIYEYQDGNLTKKTEKYTSTVYNYTEQSTYVYQYDDKKGALYHCETPKWYLILHLNDYGIKNNLTDDWRIFRPWTVYAYEYDREGFPAKRTREYHGHMHESETEEAFTYIRQ